MEYDLVHAFFGRFGVLIPLLAVFFELAGLITGKRLVSTIAGFLVILGVIVVILAGITGFIQLHFLQETYADISQYKLHTMLGTIITVDFLLIGILRIFLFFKVIEKLVLIYMIFYVINVLLNLVSNEIILHRLY